MITMFLCHILNIDNDTTTSMTWNHWTWAAVLWIIREF